MNPNPFHFNFTTLGLLFHATVGFVAAVSPAQAAGDQVAPAVPLHAQTFAPKQVTLLAGPFKHAMDWMRNGC